MPRQSKYNYSDADRMFREGELNDTEISRKTGIPRTSIVKRRKALNAAGESRRVATLAAEQTRMDEEERRREKEAKSQQVAQFSDRYFHTLQVTQRSFLSVTQALMRQIALHCQDGGKIRACDINHLSQSSARLQSSLTDTFTDTQRAILTFMDIGVLDATAAAEMFGSLESAQQQFLKDVQDILKNKQ